MRKALTMLAAVAVLTACGGGSSGSSGATPRPSIDPTLAAAATDVCTTHCERLQQQTSACPGVSQSPPDLLAGAGLAGSDYPRTCTFDMASGFEAEDAVRKSLEDAAPAGAKDLPDLFAALDKAKAAHDLFSDRCTMVGLIPEYDAPEDVRDCSEAVRESIRWLPIVARELKSATG